jgi:hypothetical protein
MSPTETDVGNGELIFRLGPHWVYPLNLQIPC